MRAENDGIHKQHAAIFARSMANNQPVDYTRKNFISQTLLDSVVSTEVNDEMDWQQLSLTAFEADWDNPDDAVYDNWRELYNVPAR